MDFFCLNPIGIRAGYPSSALLRGRSAKERRRVQGRIVRALTASPPLCASRGAPGARLFRVGHRLGIGRRFRIGLNDWYLTSDGSSRGVLKVRHGIIEEIGIADRRLTAGSRAARRFLRTLL